MTTDPVASTSSSSVAPDSSADSPRAPLSRSEADAHLRVLGLAPGATWTEICAAHARLVADLTPGPDARHRNVGLAQGLLHEVNAAFDSLRAHSSVA